MDPIGNPFLSALLEANPLPMDFIQVRIEQETPGLALRHIGDVGKDPSQLQSVELNDLAGLAEVTIYGVFRPNKAAPNLQQGWRCASLTPAELQEALEHLYPGAVADWYAARQVPPPCTPFREFIQRQTGIYRGIRSVSDTQAAEIVRAGCSPKFCLRRRLWTAPGLEPDSRGTKSVIPCLDPCGLLLESARRHARILQEPTTRLDLASGDLDSLEAALSRAIEHPTPEVREGDSANPANPRRLLFVLNQIRSAREGRPKEKEA